MNNKTQTRKGTKMNATRKSTTETWVVEYSDHEAGANGGHFIRKTEKDARRSARMMKECGYRTATYRQYTR